jgi:RNA polymerase sigma factor (TIGR02999 family)
MQQPEATATGGQKPADAAAGARPIDALLPSVYEELRGLAEIVLQRNRPIDAARTTSIIHDAYLRLADRGVSFQNRSHFLCVAARAMRFVLIDRARRATAAKRGGGHIPLKLDDDVVAPAIEDEQVLAVDEALARLAAFDERKSQIIELRFFGGLSLEETAEVLGISPATIKREWTVARAWLCRELGNGPHQPDSSGKA